MSGLSQAHLGQTAELPQPRLYNRKQALSLIAVDSVGRYVSLLVYDYSRSPIHLPVRLESIDPDLSQPLREVCSLLNHRLKIALVVDSTESTNHPKVAGSICIVWITNPDQLSSMYELEEHNPSVSEATVYKHIQKLIDAGIVKEVALDDDERRQGRIIGSR